jgi:hypothetical protein
MALVGVLAPVTDAMVSHALATGHFESMNQHEPKNAPGHGVRGALWAQSMRPARRSGLRATSIRLEYTVRIYQNMLMQPQDAIDPLVLTVADSLFAAYSGDFTLGGLVRQIDLLGSDGNPLSARAGYLAIDQKMHRVMDLTVPLILNDVYDQEA